MVPLTQRPLTASDRDSALFVDREPELAAVHRAIALGFNVIMLGPPGSGRTSTLRQVYRRLFHDPGAQDRDDLHFGVPHVVFVDAKPWTQSSVGLVQAVQAALGEDTREPRTRTEPRAAGFLDAMYRTVSEPEVLNEAHVQAMGQAARGADVVVLVDSIDRRVARDLFGRMRDVAWEFPLQWVVTGNLDHRRDYLRPPADVFFDAEVTLGPLDEASAVALLRRRLQAARPTDTSAAALQPLVERLVTEIRPEERLPRRLLATARNVLVHGADPSESLAEQARLQQRAAALGRSAMAVFLELESLGPVHAGDDELLRRLGYTRSRAVQVLRQLEEHGLVTSHTEGRRKMYTVAKERSDGT